MPATIATGRVAEATSVADAGFCLAVADVNWFTTANLFEGLDRPDVAALLLSCCDYQNALRAGRPPWRWGRRLVRTAPRRWTREHVLPPGWMKRFPGIGMRPIARSIARWRREVGADRPMALVVTYPHYRALAERVRPDVLVYLNLDDYGLYWPGRAVEVAAVERRLVAEADLTACVADARAGHLRRSVPGAADRIRHLPHGTPAMFLNPDPSGAIGPAPADLDHLPRPMLGYVGGLEHRLDWPLLERVADAFPSASLVLIGRPPRGGGSWAESAARCLERPNVHAVGWRPQGELGAYIRSFDACLIPYRTDDPFNRTCCPTKIGDFLGSGRPIVSTDLPECRLHRGRFDVADSAEGFLGALAALADSGFDDGRCGLRVAHARSNTCGAVAGRLAEWIGGLATRP